MDTFIKKHHELILRSLRKHGPGCVDEIAYHTPLIPHEIGKRMIELQRDGKVELTGELILAKSGRAQREWRIKK